MRRNSDRKRFRPQGRGKVHMVQNEYVYVANRIEVRFLHTKRWSTNTPPDTGAGTVGETSRTTKKIPVPLLENTVHVPLETTAELAVLGM